MNKTDIINAALFVIGSKKIFAPADNTKSAKYATSIYDFCRHLVYDMPIDWRWAIARSNQLAQLADPTTGPDHQYALPDNCVRPLAMVDVDGDEVEYTFQPGLLVDGGNITKTLQTNVDSGDVYIKYIVFVEDEAMYPSWFSQLIALNIALYISEPIKQHTPHYNKVKDMLDNAYVVATEANALWGVKTNSKTRRPVDFGNDALVNAAVQSEGIIINYGFC